MAISREDGSIILKTKIDESGIKTGFAKLKGFSAKAAKSFAVIGAAATAATVTITKMTVNAYAEFEQLAGGAELLFGSAAETVKKNAKEAYATVQMSQNEYLRQANGFAVGLKTALGGNEQAAADLAHKIIVAEADIIAATGETQENVQNAFNGIMKSNFTMLDNLKLGITPTQEGYQEVIDKVNAWNAANGKATEYQMGNLADMQAALVDYVEMQGMAGYASREAAETIQGSLAMTKAAWENLLIAMSTGEGLDDAVNGFVYALEKLSANITPVIERTLLGLGRAMQKTLPLLVQTVVTALVQQIPNLVVAVYNMIVGLFKGIILGIKALFTGGTAKATEVIKGNVEVGAENTAKMAGNMKKTAENTKKAGKEAKKATAAFDELNILSGGGSGSSTSPEDISTPTIETSGGGGGLLGNTDELTQEIDAQLTAIMGIAGESLIAIGLLLLFFGQVAWGIGFIIAGTVTFGVAAKNSSKNNVAKEVIGMLTTIMGIAGGALLALGIILLWFGGVVGKGVAIGMIIAGAALIVGAVVTKMAFSPNDIKGWLSTILGIAAGALLALGIILCMVGSTPIGVGMIIAGSVALVSAVALNYNEVTDKITGWVAVIMAIAGGALLVLGIVLCCTGAGIALGIALIMAGAVALVTPIALNWNYITEKVAQFFQDNAGLIVGVSIALIVLGIILLFTGVGIPLAIGLIVAGGGALAATVALNWNFIKEKTVEIFNNIMDWVKTWGLLILGIILVVSGVGIPLGIALMLKGGANLTEAQDPLWTTIVDRVKETWNAIKVFWNTHVAKWFTKEHWAGLGKNILNGLIGAVEKGLNFIITKINTLSWEVPDWVPGIGGSRWGFNFKSINIPRLAQGAVIPPNREFLAVLGDQKRGVNIETPLETMIQAFEVAMNNRGSSNEGNATVIIEIDGREFGRAVVKHGNNETRRVGAKLVTVR